MHEKTNPTDYRRPDMVNSCFALVGFVGEKKITQALRYISISNAIRGGATKLHVQAFVMHTSIDTTVVYISPSKQAMRRISIIKIKCNIMGFFDKTKEELGDKLSEMYFDNPDVEKIIAGIEKEKEANEEHKRLLAEKHLNHHIGNFADTLVYLLLIGVVYIIGIAIWQIIKLFL